MRTTHYMQNISLTLLITCCMLAPFLAGAQETYIPYVAIPGVEYDSDGLIALINQLYIMLIVAGSIFAVIKIVLAGLKWSTSDIVSNKHDAMHDIQGVLLGLAILLAPAIVLSTINKDILNLNVLERFGEAVGGVGIYENDPANISSVPEGYKRVTCRFGEDTGPGILDKTEGQCIQELACEGTRTCDMAGNCYGGRMGELTAIGPNLLACTYDPTPLLRDKSEEHMINSTYSLEWNEMMCRRKGSGAVGEVINNGTTYKCTYKKEIDYNNL